MSVVLEERPANKHWVVKVGATDKPEGLSILSLDDIHLAMVTVREHILKMEKDIEAITKDATISKRVRAVIRDNQWDLIRMNEAVFVKLWRILEANEDKINAGE